MKLRETSHKSIVRGPKHIVIASGPHTKLLCQVSRSFRVQSNRPSVGKLARPASQPASQLHARCWLSVWYWESCGTVHRAAGFQPGEDQAACYMSTQGFISDCCDSMAVYNLAKCAQRHCQISILPYFLDCWLQCGFCLVASGNVQGITIH